MTALTLLGLRKNGSFVIQDKYGEYIDVDESYLAMAPEKKLVYRIIVKGMDDNAEQYDFDTKEAAENELIGRDQVIGPFETWVTE